MSTRGPSRYKALNSRQFYEPVREGNYDAPAAVRYTTTVGNCSQYFGLSANMIAAHLTCVSSYLEDSQLIRELSDNLPLSDEVPSPLAKTVLRVIGEAYHTWRSRRFPNRGEIDIRENTFLDQLKEETTPEVLDSILQAAVMVAPWLVEDLGFATLMHIRYHSSCKDHA